jgi:hypothetical protein
MPVVEGEQDAADVFPQRELEYVAACAGLGPRSTDASRASTTATGHLSFMAPPSVKSERQVASSAHPTHKGHHTVAPQIRDSGQAKKVWPSHGGDFRP